MTEDEYKAKFTEDDSPGWAAIDAACAKLYGEGEPNYGHYAPPMPPVIGGQGPDGISMYRSGDHVHFVSYGFSTLHYTPEAAGGEFSGWGFELTFRLKTDAPREETPLWPISVMQNLYNYVNQSKRWFEPNQAIPIHNQPLNADVTFDDTEITGLWLAEDPELGRIETPHGPVQFIQMVGMTRAEAQAFTNTTEECAAALKVLSDGNPLLVTDMSRGL